MQKELKNIINQFSENENFLNRIIVSAYLRANSIVVKNNKLIKSLLISDKSRLNSLITLWPQSFTFDDVIEAFELAIPKAERVINGAVYTPTYIKEFIVIHSLNRIQKPHDEILAGDISCGCGGFLFTLAKKINNDSGKTFHRIFKDNIFGLDISKSSIKRAEILLSLLAISYGEDRVIFNFNLHTANALNFKWLDKIRKLHTNKGFDLIVGNPPYVRAKNIDKSSKKLLSNWSVTRSGNPDLYIPFFEIALEYLNENGVLGFITVNTFYKSVNARELRRYLQEKTYDASIIDFGHEKIFDGKSAYTCICLISKRHSNTISFKREASTTLIDSGNKLFNKIEYKDLNHKRGWLLSDKRVIENIKRIEAAGPSLGETFKIRNGIATLSNDTYIFKPVAETELFFVLSRNEREYKIEKSICRDIIKPNVLKHEYEIDNVKEQLIFPYTNGINPLTLIEEKRLKSVFPNAYAYLASNKVKLSKRDKGNGEYDAWYAFGRTQALGDNGYKLMFPYMAKKPHFVFTDNKEMLIYCGYAVFHESPKELKILKKILESNVFEYYMANTSKPYSAGYFSYAKNYVKNFGICELSEKERRFLANSDSKKEVNEFLNDKYQIFI